MLLRMKYINRWGLMRNTRYENLSEHSLEVAFIAHALGLIANKRLNKNIDVDRLVIASMYHDASEIITGDLPTPIKYYNNDIMTSFKKIESISEDALIDLLPEDFRDDYRKYFSYDDDKDVKILLKASDKLSALIKCIEEEQSGNNEFKKAKLATEKSIKELNCEEANIFMAEFLPSFYLTLDEQ
jgi:5'-deoxynucleotidase